MRHLILALLLCCPSGAAWAAAAQLTDSFYTYRVTETTQTYQLIRCDNSASISGTGPTGGETCEAGDWSQVIDCRDYKRATVRFFEYGGGSATALLWSCTAPVGAPGPITSRSGTIAGVADPGTEAPSAAPSAADPDPLCVELTGGASVTLDGLSSGVIEFTPAEFAGQYLIGEIDACTGDCDSTFLLTCSR